MNGQRQCVLGDNHGGLHVVELWNLCVKKTLKKVNPLINVNYLFDQYNGDIITITMFQYIDTQIS